MGQLTVLTMTEPRVNNICVVRRSRRSSSNSSPRVLGNPGADVHVRGIISAGASLAAEAPDRNTAAAGANVDHAQE